ncbi:MAG: hypothetical protein IKO72_08660 [Kiritimatiellae bacterium]|nr:hypothetical protein [Kiritimatiellia bacterium]
MAIHLTADNTGTAANDRLASVALSDTDDTHLAVVQQASKWTNKEFFATPKAARWAACMATGIEQYPGTQGGTNVYNDTMPLINAVATRMNGLSWRTGYHPGVNAFIRGMNGPYSKRNGIASNGARSEYVHSIVAYKFNLHHLHFSKMTSYTAKLRVYVPSLVMQTDSREPILPSSDSGAYHCRLHHMGIASGASQLCCRLATELPTLAADVAAGYDSWEFLGNANNGETVNSETVYNYHSVCYNPYHGDDCVSMPVWTANKRTATGTTFSGDEPTLYHHDFQFSNADNLAVLNKNPGTLWGVLHFRRANGFSNGGNHGLASGGVSYTAWFYRADLVFSCNSAKFNDA